MLSILKGQHGQEDAKKVCYQEEHSKKGLQDSTTALLDLTNCTEKQQEAVKAVLKERARIKVRSTLKRDRAIRELKAELGELQPVYYFTYFSTHNGVICMCVLQWRAKGRA